MFSQTEGLSFHAIFSPSKKVDFIESPLKMMKNAFYFILKALFVVKIFNFCPDFFGHVGKWLDKKTEIIFKIYDVINWKANNYHTLIAPYLKKQRP